MMKRLIQLACAFLLSLLAFPAAAQDFPMLQGSDARLGSNSDPNNSYPGQALISWFKPTTFTSSFVRQVMSSNPVNTANPSGLASPAPATNTEAEGLANGSPSVVNPTALSGANPATSWIGYGPFNVSSMAFMPYPLVTTGDATEDAYSGYSEFQAAGNDAIDYYWTESIASSTSSNTSKLNSSDSLNTFVWNIEPANSANRIAGNYALYTWIPTGPTYDANNNAIFPQRYFVYTITDANGTYTDVLDTNLGGTGFVRLGGGGGPTNKTFAYNGTNPIVVTLYNTVPRDALGNLTEPSSGGQISPTKAVYADAILALPQQGSYYATPIVTNLSTGATDVIQCLNVTTSGIDANGNRVNVPEGIVESDEYNTGNKRWSWSPSFVSSATIVMTANSSGVTWSSPWTQNTSPSGSNYKGTTYLTSPVTNNQSTEQLAIYKPALKDGTYQIEVWIPGNGNSQTYATAATFEIWEGNTETTVNVDESTQSGWVVLGSRRFTESNASAPLVVKVSNYSANTGDVNNLAFVDAVMFVGQDTSINGTVAITSTPLQVTVPITPSGGGTAVNTPVTIVADESGHIYCLDSNGDGAGGGKLYWAYPSLSSVSPDPNQVTGIDGPGPTAQMPSGFNLSSAIVETFGGHPYLYIGSTNGRVYCLDMEGRGDTTTTRIWSYPDDYPAVAQTSNLGPFRGSLAYVNDGTSNGAIIVPAQQGRIYALDPLGLGNSRTTYVHWAFPFTDQSSSEFSSSGITSVARPSGNSADSVWNNPPNAAALDSTYASTTPDLAAYGSSPPTFASSQYLSFTNPVSFGSIPSSATILGIQVAVVRHRTAGSDNTTYIHDLSVTLTQSGNPVGTDHADTFSDWSVGTDETKIYGGQNDLWGTSWTPASLQSGFGLDIAVQGNGTTSGGKTPPTADIDFVLVRVFYQAQTPKGAIEATPAVFTPSGAAHPYIYFGCDAYTGAIPIWASGSTYSMGDLVDAADGTGLYVSLINNNVGNSPASSSSDWQSVKSPPGQFFALDSYTGIPVWEFHGTTSWSSSSAFVAADNFNAGPAIVSAANLNAMTTTASAEGWTGSTQVDTVGVSNENNWITALNAGTGQVVWATNELESPVKGNLGYTALTVLDNSGTGTTANAPCFLVPTADGRFVGLFALTGSGFGSTNRLGTRRAWEYDAVGPLTASMSIGGTVGAGNSAFMYGADEYGFLYAFNQTGSSSSTGQQPPGSPGVTENNNSYVNVAAYRAAKVRIVDQATYEAARKGTLTFNGADTAPNNDGQYSEWGDTVYVLVYNFPYGGASQPPIVNYQFSVTGESIRNLSVQAQQVSDPSNAPLFSDGTTRLDGYAVLPFTLQGGGSNSMAPGDATCTVSISAVSGSPARYQNVALDPANDTVPFGVANPLAIVMQYSSGSPAANYSIGYTSVASDPQNKVNGSPDVSGHESQLTVPIGEVSHGSSGSFTFGVYDRSHMVKLRGNGIGLDNVRMQRSDLAFQGGMFAVQDPIPATPFASFEDYPINTPNNSLDYPDIQREQVSAVKDPTGSAENPVFAGVTLTPPTLDSSGNTQMPLNETPMQMTVSVPKFQPPNETTAPDSANASVDQGYRGQYYVFVDSFGQGQLTLDGNQREAYRSFWVGTGVQTDRRFISTTPTVDLGSLSSGAGMSPIFSPWSTTSGQTAVNGTYSGMFQPFNVTNTGNVNLVNLQVLKSNGSGSDLGVNPTSSNSYLAWLDSYFDVRSDVDLDVPGTSTGGVQRAQFALTPQVILQKARVGEVSGTTLTTNPIRQTNANLSAIQSPLYSSPTPSAPRITVQVPIGFPAGTYSQAMKIVENPSTGTPAVPSAAPQTNAAFTDPGFTLTFRVKESQLTGKPSPYVGYSNTTGTAPNLLDNYVQGTESALYGSSQPAAFRDATGNMLVAFSSTRPSWSPAAPSGPSGSGNSSLYIASMLGATPSSSGPQNTLNDLDSFSATGSNAWFKQDAGPWPSTSASTLFIDSGLTGYTINGNPSYNSPAFPAGPTNELTGGANGSPTYMVFVGNAQVNTSQTIVNESRIFLTPVTLNADGSAAMSQTIVPLPDDLDPSAGPMLSGVTKERPTILQFNDNATVFYSAAGSGHGQIFCATFDGTKWTSNAPLALPSNFDFVGAPSAYARMSGSNPVIELAFPAKVAGRPHADIYFAQLPCNSNGVPTSLKLEDLTPITSEALVAGQNGIYQAAGLAWDTATAPTLVIGGRTITGTPQVDPNTGVMSYDNSVLGGKIYLDPRAGTVQFVNTTVPANMVVALTYTPKMYRVSSGTTSDAYPSFLYDHRYLGDLSGWHAQNGNPVTDGDPTTGPFADRFVFTYGANSTGTGQAARAYMATYRFGVQLPLPIATNSTDGSPQSLTVTGNNGDYQLDPVNGRVYFTSADEGNTGIGVSYTALNPDGTTQNLSVSGQSVSMIPERPEAPLAVEQAVNESQIGAFLDPFNFAGPYLGKTASQLAAAPPRPGLIWLFWTSTRNGSPDVFFETIAPNFSPVLSK